MANNIRIKRLNHAFMEEISMILMEEVRDEDLKFVTITGCDITNDLSYAKVYFTVLDKDKKEKIKRKKRLTEVKSEERRAGTKARWASVEKGQLKSKNLNGASC